MKRQRHPRFDLVDDEMVRQIGADPPILFVRSRTIDPSTAWCLEERVHQQQEKLPIRCKDAGDLVDRRLERIDVLKSEAQDHRVEREVSKGELLRPRLHEQWRSAASVCLTNLGWCRIEAHDVSAAPGDVSSDLALSTPHVEHTTCVS